MQRCTARRSEAINHRNSRRYLDWRHHYRACASLQGVYALFASEFEVYLCTDTTYSWLSRCALKHLAVCIHRAPVSRQFCRASCATSAHWCRKWGNSTPGVKLRRGYEPPHQVRLFLSLLQFWTAQSRRCQRVPMSATAQCTDRRGGHAMAQGSTEVDSKQEDIDNAAARLPVTHLVLCVHGIGQNLTAANIAGANERKFVAGSYCCVFA